MKAIQANELRIGNLIKDGNEFEKVTSDHLKCAESGRCEFEPIPLTEEWLLKLGFVKMADTIPYNYRVHKSKMFFYIRYGTFTTDGGRTDLEGYNGLFIANKFVRVIRYVHQLQNLYFALTGEELNFDL